MVWKTGCFLKKSVNFCEQKQRTRYMISWNPRGWNAKLCNISASLAHWQFPFSLSNLEITLCLGLLLPVHCFQDCWKQNWNIEYRPRMYSELCVSRSRISRTLPESNRNLRTNPCFPIVFHLILLEFCLNRIKKSGPHRFDLCRVDCRIIK